MLFYHGGATKDFQVRDIDVYKRGSKQSKRETDYVGFYMFGEENVEKAYHYAEQMNYQNNTSRYGVAQIEMPDSLNVFKFDNFASIDRISKEQMRTMISQGYDVAVGRSVDGLEYVLLNPNRIISLTVDKEKTHLK